MRRLASGGTSRKTAWALVGEGFDAATLLAVTYLLTQTLTKTDFGFYSAIMAVATMAGVLAAVGAPWILMKRMAEGHPFSAQWIPMLATVLTGSTILAAVLVILVRPVSFPQVEALPYVLLVTNRMLLMGTVQAHITVADAHRDLRFSTQIRLMADGYRLAAPFALVSGVVDGLTGWAIVFFVSSLAAAITSVVMTRSHFRARQPERRLPTQRELLDGFPHAMKGSTAAALDSIDRPMMVAFGLETQVADYAVGYRVATLGQIPIQALLRATFPDFFAAATGGLAEAAKLSRRLMAPAVIIGVLTAGVLWLGAPLIPLIVGEDYAETAAVIRYLSALPLLRSIQSFPANALAASGKAMWQTAALLAAAALNVGMNMAAIPLYGYRGAIVTTMVSEVVYAVLLFVVVSRLVQREDADRQSGSVEV